MNDITCILRLHSLGDIIMAQPSATALSERGDRVLFITRPEYAPIVRRMPGGIEPQTAGRAGGLTELRRVIAASGAERYIDFQNSLATRLVLPGNRTDARFRTDRKLRSAILKGQELVMPLRSLDFMNVAGVEGSSVPRLERRNPRGEGGMLAGIVVGGRWSMKSIPQDVVAELCRILTDVHEAEVVLLGGIDDLQEAQEAASSAGRKGIVIRAGAGDIDTLICDIEALDILISPDSGPAHLGAALGIPTVVVFTSTSPALGFWPADMPGIFMGADLNCRPCHRHGAARCDSGSELCRKTIVPRELADFAIGLTIS